MFAQLEIEATRIDSGAMVRTVLDAYAREPSASSTPVHRITWGSLETRIAELGAERLVA